VKAIVFDVDGTLIESMSVDSELYLSSINTVLGPVNIREDLSDYDNVTDSGILAQIINDNGFSSEDEVAEAIQAIFVESLRKHIQTVGPFPAIEGAIQMVDKVRLSANTRIAIATGGWRRSALLKLESTGFNIDGIPVATCDNSPSRIEIMRTALSRIGNDFESVTYFGDAEWDRQACQNLGWNFVAVGPDLGGIESYKNIDL
jgi:phosphoglycolate phosphatase-like HAD superfamily hydrolase